MVGVGGFYTRNRRYKAKGENMDKETIECSKCGLKMFKRRERDMQTHELECDGTQDVYERFATGNKVRLSMIGIKALPSATAHSINIAKVVSLDTKHDHTVRVKDEITGVEKTLAHYYLVRVPSPIKDR